VSSVIFVNHGDWLVETFVIHWCIWFGLCRDELAAMQVKLREALAATPASAPDADSSAINDGQTGSNFVNSRRNSRDVLSSSAALAADTAAMQIQALQAKHKVEIEDFNNIQSRMVSLAWHPDFRLLPDFHSALDRLCSHLLCRLLPTSAKRAICSWS
jgi:hypothetical protein